MVMVPLFTTGQVVWILVVIMDFMDFLFLCVTNQLEEAHLDPQFHLPILLINPLLFNMELEHPIPMEIQVEIWQLM